VSVHLSEEEQIEIFKRWWKANGKIVVAVAVAIVLSYFAWTAWKEKQQVKAEEAAVRYESLLKLVNLEAGKTMTDADRATAKHLADELKQKNGKTAYANNAAFILAKLAVDSGDLDAAVKELQSLLAAKPDVVTAQIARVRLARLLIGKEAYTEASAQVAEEPSKAFAAEYAEVRGDILRAQGNKEAALTAYEKAIAATDPQQQERAMVLKMKADDLKQPAVAQDEKASAPQEKTAAPEMKAAVQEEKTQ
jgi:predicted negative regulator of RcsB-dependent stress response